MIGLLNYLKSNITDYHTSYIPIADIPVYEDGVLVEPNEVNMREACDITIGKLTRSWYSREYEEGEFAEFWTKCFVVEHIEELKRLQNRFYWQAYGSDAFSKLTGMMGEYYIKLKDWQKQVLKGVVFSVMEARYRDKNIQGKMNLRLKAAEGELWPFLVNLNNLDKIERKTLSGGGYKYVDITKKNEAGEAETYYDFPNFDTLIDGVYQWMEYYDSMTNSTSEGHRTVTNFINATEDDEDEIEVDWEAEYYSLTDGDLSLTGAALTDFYTRCQKVRSLFKKSKENAEGIFGSEELYDISSEVSYSEAMANMKLGMQRFANAAGKDIAEVFNGLTEYNIERTYLMAKNIMANENIHDEYAYYDIGTNIMTYTPGKDGSDYLLIDFQRVKLKEPLRNEKDEWTNEDTDGDGEIDRYELTDGDTTKKVDITGFIKKMVEDELYGNDSAYVRSLTPEAKLSYQAEKKERIKSTLAKVKYNIYKEREDFYEANIDNNKVDWKAWSENYMHLDDATVVALRGLTTEAEKIERLKSDNTKIEVELWKYKSNPILKDTDFDGLVDTGSIDPAKKSGEITGNITYINNAGSEVIKDTMDYRYFYLNNKMYYDELARMSLIMSNAVTNGTGGTNYDMNHIDSAMRGIGLNCAYERISCGSHQVSIAIGHREVEYDDIKKNVILISVGAAKNINEYQGFSKVGDSNWTNDSNYNENHYEAYERLSKEVYDKLKAYITTHTLKENVTYWVTGYGTGGGIANLLSARIIDTPPVSTSIRKVSNAVIFGYGSTTIGRMVDTGNTNIYTYTFGAPNVVYFDAEPEMINAAKYKSIFNVVDTNDVFAHLPSTKSGWGKYGWNMSPSGNYNKCQNVVNEYSKVFNDIDNKRDVIATTSLDDNVLFYLYTAWGYNELTNDTMYFNGMQKNQHSKFRTFYNKYYAHYKDLEKNHSIKNYYNLCKKILPEHMTIGDGWVDIKVSSNYISMPQALETMGKWYCNNVYTYDPYSTTDFTRDGNPVTFSGRFQYDYDKASQNAKRDRDMRVERYNNEHPDSQYIIENFTGTNSYKLDLETFVGNRGDHALYDCDKLNDSCYTKYKKVADDCSAFTLAVMYYATKGAMDEYDSLDIYELGGGALVTTEETEDLYENLKVIGYEKIPVKNGTYDELESGDILVASNHYEFYYVDSSGKRTSFGWGSVKDKFPNKNCSLKEVPGQPYFHCAGFGNKEFKYIYRLKEEVAYER